MPAPSAPPVPLAHAFLALADGEAPQVGPSPARALAALAAAVVLALAAPLAALRSATAGPAKLADQPAATLGSKAGVAADEDDDGAGGE
jgi:hypothetical protein